MSKSSNLQCKGKLHDGEPCPRKVIHASEWCIFHYPNKDRELSLLFSEAFEEEMKKQEKEHFEFFDFTGFDFPNKIEFKGDFQKVILNSAIFRLQVQFKSAIFKKEVMFIGTTFRRNTNFRDATFKRDAIFINATLSGMTLFKYATFEKDAIFGGATFKKRAMFIDTTFRRSVRFKGVKFSRYTTFKRVIFNTANFKDAIFETDANFGGTIFKGTANFRGAIFEGRAWFNYVTFEGNVRFNGATFMEDSRFRLRIFSIMNFNRITIEREFNININWMPVKYEKGIMSYSVQIRNPIIGKKGKIVISGSLGVKEKEYVAGISLLNTDLSKIEFIDESWIIENGRKTIIDEIFLRKQIEFPSPNQLAQTYRRLRDNYENAKRYSEAGDFFIGEMEILRKHDPSILNRILYTIYNILSKYGESVEWPIVWIFLSIILIALIRCAFLRRAPVELSARSREFINSLFLTVKAFFPFNRSE
ncbi:MAG: pentapeptide repeat-containing protein, partial [Desulfobacterales bacterium]|nr:pentapeptide repeat-containing protein [Desulfobacterales bacterium]